MGKIPSSGQSILPVVVDHIFASAVHIQNFGPACILKSIYLKMYFLLHIWENIRKEVIKLEARPFFFFFHILLNLGVGSL